MGGAEKVGLKCDAKHVKCPSPPTCSILSEKYRLTAAIYKYYYYKLEPPASFYPESRRKNLYFYTK